MSKDRLIAAYISLTLLTQTVATGCGLLGENNKRIPTPTKPVASAGATPQPSSTEGEPSVRILYYSTAPEGELDKFEAETILRGIFLPEFLTKNNLAESLVLKPTESDELILRENGFRTRRWQTINPNSKISALAEITFQAGGIVTATVKGSVGETFPWKENFAVVQPGRGEEVVDAMETVFAIRGKKEAMHVFPHRNRPGSTEIADMIIGVSADGQLADGRLTSLYVYPNGEFEYQIHDHK